VAERWQQWMPSKAEIRREEAYDRAAHRMFTDRYSPLPPTVPPQLRPERIRGWRWEQIRRRIFDRDKHTCRYCGVMGGVLECDHIIPVSRGGNNEDGNLATACFSCNRKKSAKLISEWGRCNG
jgi:hypothetical protein